MTPPRATASRASCGVRRWMRPRAVSSRSSILPTGGPYLLLRVPLESQAAEAEHPPAAAAVEPDPGLLAVEVDAVAARPPADERHRAHRLCRFEPCHCSRIRVRIQGDQSRPGWGACTLFEERRNRYGGKPGDGL